METKSFMFMELYCMYEWDGCENDDQYSHILDSARDHNIAFMFTKMETTVFIARRKRLIDWLDSFEVNYNEDCEITPLLTERN